MSCVDDEAVRFRLPGPAGHLFNRRRGRLPRKLGPSSEGAASCNTESAPCNPAVWRRDKASGDVWKTVIGLSKPTAEITQIITRNIAISREHQREPESLGGSERDLEMRLK